MVSVLVIFIAAYSVHNEETHYKLLWKMMKRRGLVIYFANYIGLWVVGCPMKLFEVCFLSLLLGKKVYLFTLEKDEV